ncbi:MAG: lipid-A-disaccharide synthase [Kiritimatiellia bacterium]
MSDPLKVMICAGEVSGDMYGGALIEMLRERFPDRALVVRGMGGEAMRAAGCELLYHTDALGAMGIFEVLRHLRFFRKVMNEMEALAREWRPDILITIDYYSFNIALAERVHALGVRTVHYISPKVWVWRRQRIYRVAKAYDALLCIFPFEPELYAGTGLRALYVGHPLVEQAAATRAAPAPVLPWYGENRLALLPGSRAGEIRTILPTFLAAARRIELVKDYDCSFIIPAPTRKMRLLVEKIVARSVVPAHLTVVEGQARHVMAQATAAMIASGTATLEACLMNCPAILAYRVSLITELFARFITRGARLKFAGLVNIILGRLAMPELLQRDFTVYETASHILPYLRHTPQRKALMKDYEQARQLLGEGNATSRAVEVIVDLLS